MKRWLGMMLIGGSVAVALVTGPAAQALTPDQSHVISLVNQARSGSGASSLDERGSLTTLAHDQAVRMAKAGSIFHNENLDSDADAMDVPWLKLGENVGVGPNVDQVEEAFMNSDHHRENILDKDFTAIGVGVVRGDDGSIYVAQVFAQIEKEPKPAAPVAKAPAPVERPAVEQPVAPSTVPVAAAAPAQAAQAPQVAAAARTAPPVAPQPSPRDPAAIFGGVVAPLGNSTF